MFGPRPNRVAGPYSRLERVLKSPSGNSVANKRPAKRKLTKLGTSVNDLLNKNATPPLFGKKARRSAKKPAKKKRKPAKKGRKTKRKAGRKSKKKRLIGGRRVKKRKQLKKGGVKKRKGGVKKRNGKPKKGGKLLRNVGASN